MKILHLLYESRGDYFGIGGVGIRAYEIYRHLKERHEITLLCKRYPGAEDREIEGLRHIFVGAESKSLTKTLLSYARHSARYVKEHGKEFDVIIEDFSPAIPTFLNFYKEKPVVLQIQGYTGKKYFGKYNIAYSTVLFILERYMPRLYKNIIFVSDSARERFNIGNRNSRIISNGISEKLLDIEPSESDYIAYLGRVDIHHKGLDILADAYKEFHKAFSGIKLIIAGDGRDKGRFSEILKKLPGDVRQNIEMVGWVEGESKMRLLKDALMVVTPSRYETQGIVALEAMACGKALVVSDIPELSYVTDCGAGVSFRSGDAASLAQAMRDMAANESRKEMGLKGRGWVKDLTWDKIAIRYEEFLSEVVARGK